MWLRNSFSLLCILYLIGNCYCESSEDVDESSSSLISKSGEAKPGQFPWMIALYNKNSYLCAGSIISTKAVLTSANCFVGNGILDIKSTHGIAGSRDRTSGIQITFKAVMLHNHSNITFDEVNEDNFLVPDIAILIPRFEIPLGLKIQPLDVLTLDSPPREGENVIVIGWAIRSEEDKKVPHRLSYSSQTILDDEICFNVSQGLKDQELCTTREQTSEQDKIYVDPGSPLVYFDNGGYAYQIGIMSYSVSSSVPNSSPIFVYTKLSSYFDLIKQAVTTQFFCSN